MRSEIATGRECDPQRWNNKSGQATGTKEDIRNFNAHPDNLQSKVYEAHRWLSERNETITAESLKNKITGRVEKTRTLVDIFKDPNLKMSALIGKEFAAATVTALKVNKVYCRMQQIDKDGKGTYSKIEAVNFNGIDPVFSISSMRLGLMLAYLCHFILSCAMIVVHHL